MSINARIFSIVLSAIIAAAFFLPWFTLLVFTSVNRISGFHMVRTFVEGVRGEDRGPMTMEYFMLAISMIVLALVPLSAINNLVRSIMRSDTRFTRMLPFASIVLFIILMALGIIDQSSGRVAKALLEMAGFLSFGFYVAFISAGILSMLKNSHSA
ncbi:MAG TPA: hypothetical protein VFZ78_07145 [Flavisolibacter sp.]